VASHLESWHPGVTLRPFSHTARADRRVISTVAVTARPGAGTYSGTVQTLIYLLVLYLKYSLVTLAVGIVVAAGLWFWLGLASFAKNARNDL
jgi:hypothetical protein